MTKTHGSKQIPQEWGPAQRIYGGPLHEQVSRLMNHPQAPSWARLVRELNVELQSRGLNHHPRTIKRQLNGKITYVPAGLETAFMAWLNSRKARFGINWVKEVQTKDLNLSKDRDPLLYVPVQQFLQLARTYQQRRPGFSRRKLALLLQKRLEAKGFSVGMEAIQSAIAGKTQRVRLIYEQEMAALVEELPIENSTTIEQPAMSYGDATMIPQWVDEILPNHPGLSRRRLAGMLQQELQSREISMSLNSLQVILSGKTQKTRRLVLDLLDSWRDAPRLNEVLNRYQANLPIKTRRNLGVEVAAAWQNWHKALPQVRGEFHQTFLDLRKAFLRERWLYRQKKRTSSRRQHTGRNRHQDRFYSPEAEDPKNNGGPSMTLDWGRLVS